MLHSCMGSYQSRLRIVFDDENSGEEDTVGDAQPLTINDPDAYYAKDHADLTIE